MMEQMGMATKTDRFNRTDGTRLGTGIRRRRRRSMNQFKRLEQFAKLQKPPPIKFKDLEAAVNSTHQVQHPADEGARGFHPASPKPRS